jgi:hypothetical protein
MTIENLQPVRSKEEAREKGRKGGIASGKARKEKKLMKEQIELLLSLPLKSKNAKNQMKKLGIDSDNVDNQMAVIIGVWQKAIQGDVKAAEFLRNTLGEAPTEKVELNASVSEKTKEIDNYINGRTK